MRVVEKAIVVGLTRWPWSGGSNSSTVARSSLEAGAAFRIARVEPCACATQLASPIDRLRGCEAATCVCDRLLYEV